MHLLRASDDSAVLRDIKFKTCRPFRVSDVRSNWIPAVRKEFDVLADLYLGFSASGSLEVSTTTPPRTVFRFGTLELDTLRTNVEAVAKEVAQRDSYIGFNIKDPQNVAKAFRYREKEA